MKRLLLLLVCVILFSTPLLPRGGDVLAGYNTYRFSLARWGQDRDYNSTAASVDKGNYYGIDTYGSWTFGTNVADNVIIGLYADAGFGFSFDFSKKFPTSVGIHLSTNPGVMAMFTMDQLAVGLKTVFVADFDRISATGIGFRPTVQVGPIYAEIGFVSPLGDSKDHDLKQFDAGVYLLAGNAAFGIKMDFRDASNLDAAKTRAKLNQFHLCLMLNP